MNSAIDRMWAVRDAVLLWLYTLAASGHRHPTLDLDEIQELTGWAADPILIEEVESATTFLKEQGYVEGQAVWGGRIPNPTITSRGECKAAEGTSVRPGPTRPANPAGNTFNVNNYGSGNFNLGGHVDSQQLWSQSDAEPVLRVVKALDRFAEELGDDGNQAKEVADELRSEVRTRRPVMTKVRALLGTAIGTVAVAAGTELGQQVTDAAVNALQTLG